MKKKLLPQIAAFIVLLSLSTPVVRADFSLTFNIPNPGAFTASQLQILEDSLVEAEAMWENAITGYRPGISNTGVVISIFSGSGFADAIISSSVQQGGFRVSTSGRIRINASVLDTFGPWDGSGPTPPNTEFAGVNFIDELLAHEIGHVLGIGTLWSSNGVYTNGTGRYTGQYGLAAYQADFDPTATYVSVELAGSSGTQNAHWDQLMRSSSQEGNPSNPWILDPRVGITDQSGRDLGLELMTGAIDPDFGEPFLSRMTIQSLRDLGFTVVPEPSTSMLTLMLIGAMFTRRKRR